MTGTLKCSKVFAAMLRIKHPKNYEKFAILDFKTFQFNILLVLKIYILNHCKTHIFMIIAHTTLIHSSKLS